MANEERVLSDKGKAFDFTEFQHTRYNPLRGEWILVSPHRMKRPWKGQTEKPQEDAIPRWDPKNPLCPRTVRASGKISQFIHYLNVNQHKEPVMCFHPWSDLTLPVMSIDEILAVIKEWISQFLKTKIWASSFLPNEAAAEDRTQKEYLQEHNVPMLVEYARLEEQQKVRIVVDNKDWIVVVPFWATWPYEVLLLPRRHVLRLSDLTEEEQKNLADIMKRLLIKYDNLFKVSFPYSMGWHGAPTGKQDKDCRQVGLRLVRPERLGWSAAGGGFCGRKVHLPELHMIVGQGDVSSDLSSIFAAQEVSFELLLPPSAARLLAVVLGSLLGWSNFTAVGSKVKKFMVGYEMLAQSQRDLTAEQKSKQNGVE
ncbi:Galactose-1-phosphate uridylyltransferase [Acropora cervicornis]|uniref:Galactose-1-phosphate uridylyltransferase n=1 Tax=Acropora cervicornis TaxID=6130 RepID=A0AAD9PRK9_ACRCE|nr:Galactose-1-phosphate uridylyltransferase [Acropora cervicornis]